MYTPSTLTEKIDEAIAKLPLKTEPQTLFEPIKYILSLGGKRLRPVLTLMATNLFSNDIKQTMEAALAIEVFHNFSLLHDDLMDRSELRRGQKTVHKKWNDNVAILSGDAMLIEAYKLIAKVPQNLLPEILELFSQTALEVCEGQQFDMDFETRLNVTEAEYLNMIRLKTAVLLACGLKIGAIIAKVPEPDADLLYQFGINIGLAFQLKDDLLDVYGDPKTFGKKIGGDILCNKKTYLLIKALKNSRGKQKTELLGWITASDFDPESKINAVKKIYNELNLGKITQNLIENYYLAALDCLSGIEVGDDKKKELFSLAENLMYREK
ncbi:MAG: polyprenyl synthetase family protein [Dysgonamonadaceae bacterium]|nr:polyprenyl synthetase family protein [Dysgonamonadaceae bacterium]